MATQLYVVKQGDSPDAIAQKYGFPKWSQIYEHPDNGALRSERGPSEVKEGDQVIIPALPESNVQAGATAQLIATSGAPVILPPVTFDAHMHIMSGNCTPMPAVYGLLEDKGAGILARKRISRKNVNRLGRGLAWFSNPLVRLPEIGEFSPRPTERIGQEVVKLNSALVEDREEVYVPPHEAAQPVIITIPSVYSTQNSCKPLLEAKESFLGLSVALTMDMDFCHLDGYDGDPVYQKEGGRWFYHHRTSPEPQQKGERVFLSADELALFETWNQQVLRTELVAAAHPLRVLPLFHFEPRRYIKMASMPVAFKKVATPEQTGCYVGLKMYSPQGYKPLDPREPLSGVQKAYYQQAAQQGIPIMTHCTPSGFYTHDRKFYLDNEPDGALRQRYMPAKDKLDAADERIKKAREELKKAEETPWYKEWPLAEWRARNELENAIEEREKLLHPGRMRYFYENLVHPERWRKVLELSGCSSLRLCLAHFASDKVFWDGSKGLDVRRDAQGLTYDKSWVLSIVQLCKDFENVYTDISYLPLLEGNCWKKLAALLNEFPWMLKKIMYGTDWYMVTAEPKSYEQWHRDALGGLQQAQALLKQQVNLFYQFAIVNPARFYRVVEIGPKLKEGYKQLISKHRSRIQEQLKGVEVGKLEQQLDRNYLTLMRLQAPLEQIHKAGGLASGPILFTNTPS